MLVGIIFQEKITRLGGVLELVLVSCMKMYWGFDMYGNQFSKESVIPPPTLQLSILASGKRLETLQ